MFQEIPACLEGRKPSMVRSFMTRRKMQCWRHFSLMTSPSAYVCLSYHWCPRSERASCSLRRWTWSVAHHSIHQSMANQTAWSQLQPIWHNLLRISWSSMHCICTFIMCRFAPFWWLCHIGWASRRWFWTRVRFLLDAVTILPQQGL